MAAPWGDANTEALPLSIGGALIALPVTGQALSMPSMIGPIVLMGVVPKNSIFLIGYAILASEACLIRFDALVNACHKFGRPTFMTTLAMGSGMSSLALSWGRIQAFVPR